MGEELELKKVYLKVGDEYVPFDGIKAIDPTDIWVGDEMDEDTYANLIRGGTVSFEVIQTHKQARQTAKAMNAIVNCYRRRLRTLHRQKEKERRRALKS